jgi:hypothetical protein
VSGPLVSPVRVTVKVPGLLPLVSALGSVAAIVTDIGAPGAAGVISYTSTRHSPVVPLLPLTSRTV